MKKRVDLYLTEETLENIKTKAKNIKRYEGKYQPLIRDILDEAIKDKKLMKKLEGK